MRIQAFTVSCLIFFLLSSCSWDEKNNTSSKSVYFDIKGFFEDEISRLSNKNPTIFKEIQKNGQKEGKLITIKKWSKELSLFIESDINKPSWLTSYEIKVNGDTISYNALTDDLRIRNIQVIKSNNRVAAVVIKSRNINKLYESNEFLSYYPDSLYVIKKDQHVKIIGDNNYKITGSFIK